MIRYRDVLAAGLLAAALFVQPVTAANAWQTAASIPWGQGSGQLQQAIRTAQVYKGPGSILAFEGGSFAILDTLGNAIKEFDSSGQFKRELTFPGAGPDRKPTMGCDMASSGPGEYWVLSADRNVVLHVKADEPVRTIPVAGATKNSVLMAISRDDEGILYVLDGNDGALVRMDANGRALSRLRHRDLNGMIVDRKGHVYDLRLANRRNARNLELVRWSTTTARPARPPEGQPGFDDLASTETAPTPEVVARITSRLEVNRMDVFGVDREGNIYVCLTSGAIENPSKTQVVRFSPAGQETGRVDAPADPVEPRFTHAKVVSPDGTVYALAVNRKSLNVLKLSSWEQPVSAPSTRPRSDIDPR